MSDQTADITRIKESAGSLARIHREFSRNANPADGLGIPTLGEQGLVDVFDDFGDNWKIHRERLTDELKKLSDSFDGRQGLRGHRPPIGRGPACHGQEGPK